MFQRDRSPERLPYAMIPVPTLLYVDWFSRREGLKVYTRVLRRKPKGPQAFQRSDPTVSKYEYVNLDADIFYFPFWLSFSEFTWNVYSMIKVRHFAFPQHIWGAIVTERNPGAQSYVLALCTGLKTITILDQGGMMAMPQIRWDTATIENTLRIRFCNDAAWTKEICALWQAEWNTKIAEIRGIDFGQANLLKGRFFRRWQPSIEFKLGCFYRV
jgi:hypothetical protein